MDLDRFVNQQNIARYRKLLDIDTDELKRHTISRLLTFELEKSEQLAPSVRAL